MNTDREVGFLLGCITPAGFISQLFRNLLIEFNILPTFPPVIYKPTSSSAARHPASKGTPDFYVFHPHTGDKALRKSLHYDPLSNSSNTTASLSDLGYSTSVLTPSGFLSVSDDFFSRLVLLTLLIASYVKSAIRTEIGAFGHFEGLAWTTASGFSSCGSGVNGRRCLLSWRRWCFSGMGAG